MDHTRKRAARWRIFHVYLGVASVVGTVYGVVLALLGAWWTVGSAITLDVACLVAFAFVRAKRARAAFASMLVGALIGGTWLAATTGGLDSPSLVWLTLLPFMGGTLLGKRAAAGLGVAGVLVVITLGVLGKDLPRELHEGTPFLVLAGLAGTCCIAVLTYFGWTATTSFERAEVELTQARDAALTTASDLERKHRDLRAVLDNVAQGLLRVGLDGTVLPGRSAVLDLWFGKIADDAKLWDVLRAMGPHLADLVEFTWPDLAADTLPVEVILDQLPKLVDCGGVTFELSFRPIDTPLTSVLVVISDVSDETAARAARARDADLLALFDRSLSDPRTVLHALGELDVLLNDAQELAAELQRRGDQDPTMRALLARQLHTFKGAAALAGMAHLAHLAHETEDRLAAKGEVTPDDLSQLVERWSHLEKRVVGWVGRANDTALVTRAELDALSDELRRGACDLAVTRVRHWSWERVSTRLEGFADSARRIAERLEKAEPITIVDAPDAHAPPSLGSLWPALSHAVRNAIDHGIEPPEVRGALGKPERGTLELRARTQAGVLEIELRDDGRGIDWDAVAAKAAARGLPHATREERFEALFADGITTRSEVSEISGRGVGMGALRETVRSLGGTLTLDSLLGRGTTLRVRIPFEEEGTRAAA